MDGLLTTVLVVCVIIMGLFLLRGLALIRDNEVGIVTKKMFGKKLPEGRIIAANGEIGVQAETLMPGLYWRIPVIWKIEKAPVTAVPPDSIGIVESIDGKPLQPGRILGDEVECMAFQNARQFLDNGGFKGLQLSILKPGEYRINTKVFRIRKANATSVPKEKVGIVIALDGTPLPSDHIIAPTPQGDHKHFQDGQAFINRGGYRGPQLETLQPGEYYINPFMFEVNIVNISTVPAGYVAVLVSSVGVEAEESGRAPDITITPDLKEPITTAKEVVLISDKNSRGILKDPVAPGKYNLNVIAYHAELVPTSAVTISWLTESPGKGTDVIGVEEPDATAKATEFYRYAQLRSTSKDGFQLDVDVKLICRIPPENAPYVIARFGTVDNLIEQVIHPLIDSLFRNEAGSQPAMQFLHSRTALQEIALRRAREEFEKYHVEVQGLLIAYIKVDEKLLETQTKKEIAVQQQAQYEQEAKAQESRITVQEKTARADKQRDVIAAQLGIDIAANEAMATIKKAEGAKQSIILEADGRAYEARIVGQATAEAYKAQTDVIGSEKVALLQALQAIGDNKIVITPNVLVTGESGGTSLFNTYIATLLAEGQKKQESSEDKHQATLA
jgi:regulator of protease activity HflC (stomatin/prohibitin superfamily)